MPLLPLDHPEPFAATLGIMLYPGAGDDRRKARSFPTFWLAKPIRRLSEAGHGLSAHVMLRLLTDGGEPLHDLADRWWGGTVTGELFKALWALYHTDAALASWNNAVRIAETTAARARVSGSRSGLWKARRRFHSVAHLWAAWVIREGRFETHPHLGYDGCADFHSFLAEAEILRAWGQEWLPPRSKSEPLLPRDVWHTPAKWAPPARRRGWPETGKVPHLKLSPELLAGLQTAGRPRKYR